MHFSLPFAIMPIMTKLFVSVIVPVYNGEKHIAECLDSLVAQDYDPKDYEILVIDNRSTDRTPEILRRYPVKKLEQRQIQSSYAARNTGIQAALGTILAFIDADCKADSAWLKNGIALFADATIGAVAGAIQPQAATNPVQSYLIQRNLLSQKHTIQHPFLPYAQTANAFYRKVVLDKIGLFESAWISGGDADLAWRMQLQTQYKLAVAEDAIVVHQHCSTATGLFRLFMKYGHGAASLQQKYHLQQPAMKQNIREIWYFFKYLLKNAAFSYIQVMSDVQKYKARYELIAYLGIKLGKLRFFLGCS